MKKQQLRQHAILLLQQAIPTPTYHWSYYLINLPNHELTSPIGFRPITFNHEHII